MVNKKRKNYHLKVKKKDAQNLIKSFERLHKGRSILDKKNKVFQEKNHVFFPVKYDKKELKNMIRSIGKNLNIKIIKRESIYNKKFKYNSLKDALKTRIPEKYLELIPKSFDIIGNIAIIELDLFDNCNIETDIKKKIALAILHVNKNVKSVFEKVSEISGVYRLKKIKFLEGIYIKETVHRENNCFFNINIEETFFTPRLLSERKRISNNNIKSEENIVDLFAGVGPFSIQIARKNNVKIYSFDINPKAIDYFKKNIELNKLKGKILPTLMDVKDLLKNNNKRGVKLTNKIDRIIMNLPEKSLEYINVACHLIKEEGAIVHIYQFCDKPNSITKAINNLKNKLGENNWIIQTITYSKILKHISPKTDMIVIDAYVKKLKL
ncbi:MAG: methyltransferase [Candidatus Lokiarchaeota archaeon]|nr:methyltransferase [Candidatus Lokiarchaeota archaeon]